jgi:hypothetical protein
MNNKKQFFWNMLWHAGIIFGLIIKDTNVIIASGFFMIDAYLFYKD